jgi:O-antigen/teichoic acid export membrane protein
MSLRSRHTLRSHIWQSLANYTQQGFGLIFGVVLARLLTPSDFGAYGLALSTVVLALLPAMWSLAPTLLADSGRTADLYQHVVRFTWSIVAVRLIIVCLLVSWFFAKDRQTTAWLCVLIGFTEAVRELNNVQKGLLEGAGRFEPNFLSVFVNVIFCVVVVIPICFVYRGPYILTLPPLGAILTDFAIYRFCTGRSVLVRPITTVPRKFFHNGFLLWLNTASEIGLIRFDKWFVGRFRGDDALGHYSRAFGYAPLAFLALSSFATNPTVSGLARCETAHARLHLFRRTALILLAGGLLNWLIFFPFARQIILGVFGPQWESTIPIFRAFASLSLAYAIMYLPITAMLAQGRYRELAVVRACFLVGFVAILLIFRASASPVAVAWLFQLMMVIQGLLLLFFIRTYFLDQPEASQRIAE